MTPESLKACRDAFEKWALPYLRSQYSFYNDEMLKEMIWKSTGRTLYDAWQAAYFSAPLPALEELRDAIVDKMNAQKLSPGGDGRHIHNAAFTRAIDIITAQFASFMAQKKGE